MVYLDNAATTRLAPEAREAMQPFLNEQHGNPSALHRLGLESRRTLEGARSCVAKALGADPTELVFTSGGTEGNNLAIWGALNARHPKGALDRQREEDLPHLVCSAIEHPSVLKVCSHLAERGFPLTVVPVDYQGRIDPQDVLDAVRPNTLLVSVMHVNNEVGTIQPLEEIAHLVKARHPRVLIHSDAVQSFTKVPLDVQRLGVDLLSISAHKLHGPLGVGALMVRKGVRLAPILHGGGQEGLIRPGTENLLAIVGFAAAVQAALSSPESSFRRVRALRNRFLSGLLATVPGATLNGAQGAACSPYIIHLSVPGMESEVLVHALEGEGVYASAGSACHSRTKSLSTVLKAMGHRPDGSAQIRFSLSQYSTEEEVDLALDILAKAIRTYGTSAAKPTAPPTAPDTTTGASS